MIPLRICVHVVCCYDPIIEAEPKKWQSEAVMVNIPGNVEWVAGLIPDLEARLDQFVVSTEELDDELVEVFYEEIKRLTGELQEGLAQNDDDTVRTAAHSIKGMGGTIGLPEISVLGLEIENRAKDDRFADIKPLVDALADWLTAFR
jgi:HPt (histidine-containing phosphotransfer) domain-containing protein